MLRRELRSPAAGVQTCVPGEAMKIAAAGAGRSLRERIGIGRTCAADEGRNPTGTDGIPLILS